MPELNMDSPNGDLLWKFAYEVGENLINEDGSVFKNGMQMRIIDICEDEELEVWGHASREEVVTLHEFLGKYLAETINSDQTES